MSDYLPLFHRSAARASRLNSLCLLILIVGVAPSASSLNLGGFTFDLGEQAFADDAFLLSGTIRWWCGGGTSIPESISGSDLSDCLNNNTGDSGVVEVVFLDNAIVNGPGTDLVVFELSGHLEPGTPEPRERFGVSVFDGVGFSSFVDFTPIATGIESAPGALDIFVVEVDLRDFGLAAAFQAQRIRLKIYDVGLGTKSADVAALGALNAIPVSPCADGLDNDNDGLIDLGEDFGCTAPDDSSERDPGLACDDGLDNDGDTMIDFVPDGDGDGIPDGDPGCSHPLWPTEAPECQDGINNDFATGIDFDGGLSVWGVMVDQPDPQCVNQLWSMREAPGGCGLGYELGLLIPPLLWLTRRRGV